MIASFCNFRMTAVCLECGGSEFHKEAGYYYCSECQTQSQELREHVFAVDLQADKEIVAVATGEPKSETARDVNKSVYQKGKGDARTSWEYYSYILLGLVKELIELGASEELQKVVKLLWFKYLEKLEVLGTPKLAAIHHKG